MMYHFAVMQVVAIVKNSATEQFRIDNKSVTWHDGMSSIISEFLLCDVAKGTDIHQRTSLHLLASPNDNRVTVGIRQRFFRFQLLSTE